mgnify:FL=1
MNYNLYLQTDHWQTTRKEKLSKVDHCQICDTKDNLHIHHRRYFLPSDIAFHEKRNSGNLLFNEKLGDLFVLCSSCHKLWHTYFGKTYLRHKIQSKIRRLLRSGVDRKKAFWLCTQPGLYQTISAKLFTIE